MELSALFQTDLSIYALMVLTLVAFAAGFMGSISGGGSFLTVPAMVLAGVPVHVALGTDKVMALSTISALFNYVKHRTVPWRLAYCAIPMTILGNYFGVELALYASVDVMEKVMLFAFPLLLLTFLKERLRSQFVASHLTEKMTAFKAVAVSLFIGFLDGFYAPGSSTIAIICYTVFLKIPQINVIALVRVVITVSSTSGIVLFGIAGKIDWMLGIYLSIGCGIGSYFGSHMAIKKGDTFIQKVIIASGLILMLSVGYRVLSS